MYIFLFYVQTVVNETIKLSRYKTNIHKNNILLDRLKIKIRTHHKM